MEAATTEFPDTLKSIEGMAADINNLRRDFDILHAFVHDRLPSLGTFVDSMASGIAGKMRTLINELEPFHRGIAKKVDIDDEHVPVISEE